MTSGTGHPSDQLQSPLTSQDRLDGLLRVHVAVADDVGMPGALRHVVQAANDLAQARYGALGIVRPDGEIEEFIYVGMDADAVGRIDHLPRGHGLLGLWTHVPDPVRLVDLSGHPDAVGFPPGHPPMSSFLSVPIRVNGRIAGNLYLTDSVNDEFSAEDEQMVTALAAAAGAAVTTARLHQETLEQRRWMNASSQLTRALFSRTGEPPLEVLLEFALQAAGADMATFTARIDDLTGKIEAAAGDLAALVGHTVTLESTLVGDVIRDAKPIRVRDYAAKFKPSSADRPIGAAVGVPLLNPDGAAIGALIIARAHGRPCFTDTDENHLLQFAGNAGVALELQRAQHERVRLTQIEDHDRIAAGLHQHVVAELFTIGMGLHSMVQQLSRPEQRTRLGAYAAALDNTILHVQATVDDLGVTTSSVLTLSQRLEAVLEPITSTGLILTDLELSGPLRELTEHLTAELVTIVRERISRIIRVSQGAAVRIAIKLNAGILTLSIIDDAQPDTPAPTIDNHAGILQLRHPPEGGNHLIWTATNPASIRP